MLRLSSFLPSFPVLGLLVLPAALSAQERIWNGEQDRSRLGAAAAGVGDLDADGLAEVAAGATGYDGPAGSNSGRLYVWNGSDGSLRFVLEGEAAGDEFGASVAAAGDVDGDGVPDLIVGAPLHDGPGGTDAGRACLFRGSDGAHLRCLDGEAAGDHFGYRVAGVGDVDGDGLDDVAVSANEHDGPAGADAGRLYVFRGVDGALLLAFDGEAAGDTLGDALAGLGDLTGDGRPEILAGASGHDGAGTNAGRAYVIEAASGALHLVLDGEASWDFFACAADNAGDLNCDGYADLLIGAGTHDGPGGTDAGRAYVFDGLSGTLLYQWDGEAAGDNFGIDVAGAGDPDGDGFSDVLVGAFLHNGEAGRAYLYSGIDGSLARTFDGAAGDRLGLPVAGAGDVDGDGMDDLLAGLSLHDASGPDAGAVWLWSGSSGYLLTADDPVVGGQPVTLEVLGATPGAEQFLAYSCLGKGHFESQLLGVTLALNQPQLFGTAVADATGRASWTAVVPMRFQGIEFRAQVAETGRRTNVVRRVLQ